jgi:hypothetical protein
VSVIFISLIVAFIREKAEYANLPINYFIGRADPGGAP